MVSVFWEKSKAEYLYQYGSTGKYDVKLYARATPAPVTTPTTVIIQTTTTGQVTSQDMSTMAPTPQSTRKTVYTIYLMNHFRQKLK